MPLTCQWARPPCGLTFATPEVLHEHLCVAHVGRKREGTLTLECGWDGCFHRASKRDHMTSHMMVHCPLKTNVCPICGKTFKRTFDLRKHMDNHGADPSSRPPMSSRRSSVDGSFLTSGSSTEITRRGTVPGYSVPATEMSTTEMMAMASRQETYTTSTNNLRTSRSDALRNPAAPYGISGHPAMNSRDYSARSSLSGYEGLLESSALYRQPPTRPPSRGASTTRAPTTTSSGSSYQPMGTGRGYPQTLVDPMADYAAPLRRSSSTSLKDPSELPGPSYRRMSATVYAGNSNPYASSALSSQPGLYSGAPEPVPARTPSRAGYFKGR